MTSEAKKIARLRLIKKLGFIGLISTSAFIVVFLVLSLLPQGNAAFTMRIDNPTLPANSNFRMLTNYGDPESETNYIVSDPLSKVDQVDAMDVENYLANLESYSGCQNFVNEDNKGLAIVQTVYLANQSEEDIAIKYKVRLDGYNPEPPHLLDYFRVLVQTELDGTKANRYFGQPRDESNQTKYVFEELEDPSREVIGKPERYTDSEGRTRYKVSSVWNKLGNDGFCENFIDYHKSSDIVDTSVSIPAGKTLRFTYVSFFEGNDPDSFKVAPSEDQYLLLSLHFGE